MILNIQKNVPSDMWVQLFEERLKDVDCVRRGWILIDFPTNREQTLVLQRCGLSPKHVGK